MRRPGLRGAILGGALVLVALPLLVLGVAYGYERWLLRSERAHLLGTLASLGAGAEPLGLARDRRVLLRLLDREGRLLLESDTAKVAVQPSLVGGALSRLLGEDGAAPDTRLLEAAQGPIPVRPEVMAARGGKEALRTFSDPGGGVLLLYLAAPLPDGRIAYLMQASRRGVRRLVALRGGFVKLLLYDAILAGLGALWLIRRVVGPLEALARASRSFPGTPLADGALLGRRDEIGALCRALVRLTSDLEARRRETAEIGADIAHEFKNPLAIIASAAELLGTTQEAPLEKRRRFAAHIEEAVERLRRAVDDLLGLLRLEAEIGAEAREPVPYGEMLGRLLDGYRLRRPDLTFTLAVGPDVGAIEIVPDRWAELLRNLLDNALVQPAERREIVVRAEREGGAVVTTVRDFGPGVPPGNLDKIFGRFFTQRPPGAPPGAGLGLSTVRAVAQAHGASVEVRSPPGEGATFRVILPR